MASVPRRTDSPPIWRVGHSSSDCLTCSLRAAAEPMRWDFNVSECGRAPDTPYDIFQIFTSIVKITGNHTIKAGVDLRDYRESTYPHGNSDGTFSFNSNWVNGPNSTAAAQPFGGDLASFLLGFPAAAVTT